MSHERNIDTYDMCDHVMEGSLSCMYVVKGQLTLMLYKTTRSLTLYDLYNVRIIDIIRQTYNNVRIADI